MKKNINVKISQNLTQKLLEQNQNLGEYFGFSGIIDQPNIIYAKCGSSHLGYLSHKKC